MRYENILLHYLSLTNKNIYLILLKVCKIKLRYTRNLAVEKILENLPISCRFSIHGCNEQSISKERVEHEKVCLYREVQCPYLECKKKFTIPKLVDHIPEHTIVAKSVQSISKLILTVKEANFSMQDQVSLAFK